MTTTTPTNGIRTVKVADAALDAWPIPAEQILGGDPQASGVLLWQSDDKRLANGVWECTPGSFTWSYTWDETIFVREGAFTMTDQTGTTTSVGAGDLIFVPSGTQSTWNITETVRKVFHFRSAKPVDL